MSAENVEKEAYTYFKAGSTVQGYVTGIKAGVAKLLGEINSGLTDATKEEDDEKFQEKVSEYSEKLREEYDDIVEKTEEKDTVSISKMDCLKELKDFDKRMKPLIDFLKDTDKFITTGTKAAEKAKKEAEKESWCC